jgi:hypothetical protein
MTCSIAGALEAIGDRWAVLILRDLMYGLSRYEDLRRFDAANVVPSEGPGADDLARWRLAHFRGRSSFRKLPAA